MPSGYSVFKSVDLDESEEQVKATAARVYGIVIHNDAAAARFVKLYDDTAANVTVGTTVPDMTIGVPADSVLSESFPDGIEFDTALTAAATTAAADNDSGAPGANDIQLNLIYK